MPVVALGGLKMSSTRVSSRASAEWGRFEGRWITSPAAGKERHRLIDRQIVPTKKNGLIWSGHEGLPCGLDRDLYYRSHPLAGIADSDRGEVRAPMSETNVAIKSAVSSAMVFQPAAALPLPKHPQEML